MIVSFKNAKEETFYRTERSLIGVYGAQQARKIIQRLLELEAADNPQKLPGNCRFHEHSGKRKGLYSLDLRQPYRLIVAPVGNYNSWVEIKHVRVVEVMDPH